VDEDIVAWTFNFMPLISARSAAPRGREETVLGKRRESCKWRKYKNICNFGAETPKRFPQKQRFKSLAYAHFNK